MALGELTMHHSNGRQALFKARIAVFVQPRVVHFERNEGRDVLEFVATFVVAPGSPLRVEAAPMVAACPS
jgi:hypothetical protein